ncbi:PucR family transcriptional regulator [Lacrimispora sp.]|uniref:PucR family transcriptional regulator n=1 Tax=Lacrimispora sp. TaxID=2719234 RepID=UPI0039921430
MKYPPLTLGWFLYQTPIDNLEFIGEKEALNKTISGISVLDNPDGVNWIKKNEIILTTGYIFYNNAEVQKKIIADLHAIDCTAFCIKVKRFFDKIPETIIEEAAKYRLPLVSVPFYHGYSSIISVINQSFMEQNISKQQYILNEAEKFHELFLKKEGIMKILERISGYTDSIAMVTTTAHVPIYYHIPTSKYGELFQLHKIHVNPSKVSNDDGANEDRGMRIFYCNDTRLTFQTFLLPDKRHYLCIDVTKKELNETIMEILKQVLSVIALELSSMQLHAKAFAQKNYYDSFFYMLTDIKNKSIEEIQLICDTYSFPCHLKRVCITLECESKENKLFRSLYNAINQKLIQLNQKYFLCHNENHIVIFLLYSRQTPNVEAISLANQTVIQLSDSMKDYHSFFRLGISRCHTSYASIARAYEESLQTLHLQTSSGPPPLISSYTRQFAYHLLTQLTSYEVRKIYEDTVSILVAHDEENKSELFVTLKAYLEQSLSLTDTAQKLFIHRNTLTSRLTTIKKLLCTELTSMEEIFHLYMGVCAAQLLNNM